MSILTNKKNKKCWKDYLLMFLMLGISANPFLGQNIESFIIIGLLYVFVFYPFTFKIDIDNEAIPILIILFFISFEFIHKAIFDLHNTKTIIRILGYYFFAYFSVKALKTKFIDAYISIIYYLAIISLIFYVVSLIPGINIFIYNFADKVFTVKSDFSNEHVRTLIIYTFPSAYFKYGILPLRNAGFTWEPGAFGIFLNLALFFYVTSTKISVKTIFIKKKSIVMMIALLLTFSTTAYVVFGLSLIYFSFNEKGSKKYVLIIVVGFMIFFSFTNLDFLKNKVAFQVETAQESHNRFGSAIIDWQYIKQRPFFGWSRKGKVLFGRDAGTFVSHLPNGLTNYLRSYGFINMFFFLIILFVSFKKYFRYINKKNASMLSVFVLLIILLSSFSELIFGKVILKAFLFLSFVYPSYIKKKKYVNDKQYLIVNKND